MLGDAMRARLGGTLDRSKPSQVNIQERIVTRHDNGDITDDWLTTSTVSARIGGSDQRIPSESIMADALISETLWTIAVPRDTVVTKENRIVSVDTGTVYAIIDDVSPESYKLERRLICSVVR